MDARFFSETQRRVLFVAAEGKCEQCGELLGQGWHADHIIPWSVGGLTDVSNGQALCAGCNQRKGGSTMNPWPYPYPQRYWQQRAEERFQIVRQQKDDFLMVACPGAGKTDGALPLVARLFESGKARRLVVVGHTDEICEQWKKAALGYGLLISRAVSETKEFRGAVVTYQQIKRSADLLRLACAREPTVVLFDEVHHAAEGLDWGDAIRQAFGGAAFRIMLSGTPFRSDDRPIPFVEYPDGVCAPDFSYGLQEALDDGEVVRQPYFPTTDGGAEWMADGELKSALLSEVLSEADAAARLRTILDPWGQWMRATAVNAHKKLQLCRQLGHAEAGTIWHCMDQRHAKETAKMVAEVIHEEPVVAISEDARSAEKIRAFRSGTQEALISVRQVSEGVDIPRLRVAVYATNYSTPLFFRQALGRVLRWVPGLDEQCAYMFVPRIKELVQMALEVIQERVHTLGTGVPGAPPAPEVAHGTGIGSKPGRRLIVPIASWASLAEVISHGQEYSQAALEKAQRVCASMQTKVSPEEMVMALVSAGLLRPGDEGGSRSAAPIQREHLDTTKERLRSQLQREVGYWAHVAGVDPQEINRQWLELTGVPNREATLEGLARKLEWIRQGIEAELRFQEESGSDAR